MKKLIALCLVCACLLSVAACNQILFDENTQTAESTANQQPSSCACKLLSAYLDDVNFVPGLSQGALLEQMERYSYSGETVADLESSVFYDGPYGGGLDAPGELFGFNNDYSETEDHEYANYSNSFYTKVPLDGLKLPAGISFEDALGTAINKLVPDADWKDRAGTVTLCSDDHSLLELTKHKKTSEELPYKYELKYTQTYQLTRDDGSVTDVIRSITMSFSDSRSKLGLFEIAVRETYQTQDETQALSEIPGAKVHLVEIRDISKEEDIACASALEKFWEDEANVYYFECIKSQYVYAMDSTGMSFDIITALNKGLATIEDLDTFGIGYITEPKQ